MNDGSPELRDLVGADVPEAELSRLQRAHELMLTAGPVPELPLSLQSPPAVEDERDASAAFALLPRRGGRIVTVAAAFALMTLVIGYVIGNHRGGFHTDFKVEMAGTKAAPHATGLIRVGKIDSVGNWPLEVQVAGLRQLPKGSYYVLYLTRHRRRATACGTFRVQAGATTVRMNAPYDFGEYDGWIVIAHGPGEREGPPLLAKYFA